MTITISGTTGIAGVDGSAATPAVQGVDTNTGVFYGTDIVGISTGGTERMRVTNTGVALSAGTASVAPLNFTSGTNLTTATAGVVEYDGKVFYGTPQGTQRGVIPGAQFYRLNADYVGTASTSAQGIYGSSLGVTLSSSTVYAFEMVVVFSKTATATAHSLSIGFSTPGSSINNILYGGVSNTTSVAFASGATGGPNTFISNTTSATSLGNSGAVANFNWVNQFKGTVSVNVGGTFIPQYTTSVSVGPYSTLAGSYILIYPIGSAGLINVGTWA
jgi:hypothetical protein